MPATAAAPTPRYPRYVTLPSALPDGTTQIDLGENPTPEMLGGVRATIMRMWPEMTPAAFTAASPEPPGLGSDALSAVRDTLGAMVEPAKRMLSPRMPPRSAADAAAMTSQGWQDTKALGGPLATTLMESWALPAGAATDLLYRRAAAAPTEEGAQTANTVGQIVPSFFKALANVAGRTLLRSSPAVARETTNPVVQYIASRAPNIATNPVAQAATRATAVNRFGALPVQAVENGPLQPMRSLALAKRITEHGIGAAVGHHFGGPLATMLGTYLGPGVVDPLVSALGSAGRTGLDLAAANPATLPATRALMRVAPGSLTPQVAKLLTILAARRAATASGAAGSSPAP